MKTFFSLVIVVLCLFWYPLWGDANTLPVVSNVHVKQKVGTQLVEITYDVEDADRDLLTVSVQISDDGGVSFNVPARTFTGDVGSGIMSGRDKLIIWDAGEDIPNTYGTNYRAKVIADDSVMGKILTSTGPMVLIPAGEFMMGDAFNEGEDAERPQHRVYTDAFYIDQYEVTNAQYKTFCDATGRVYPEDFGWGGDNYPVINITWDDAVAYARWAGKRLPTEAEWEKAARGGLVGKRYPWGNEINHDKANYWQIEGLDQWRNASPVGTFPPNRYGLYDIAGNVWEWCADWYDENYYSVSPTQNPTGPLEGTKRVARGGSWYQDPTGVRVATRGKYVPTFWSSNIGFRCVLSSTSYSGVTSTSPMVLIPPGDFLMGDMLDGVNSSERPQHRVYLDAFYIDQYEVTNAQFKAFCDATGRAYPSDPGFGGDYTSNYFQNNPDYPVVMVSWEDVFAYAQWTGKRLPTEAEWEKAARGGLEGKRYTWGDVITHDNANYYGTGGRDLWYNTSPVGLFPPNEYGLYDMAGNVREWCADWYDEDFYSVSPERNPSGPVTGRWHVLRGGSWGDLPIGVRVAYRLGDFPPDQLFTVGFRCAKSLTFGFALTVIFKLDIKMVNLVAEEATTKVLPQKFQLLQNIPNPFNPETLIRYALPIPQRVLLVIYDAIGQEIRLLVEREQEAGWYSVIWDGKDKFGQEVASGVYICRFEAGSFVEIKKMLILR